MKCVPSAVLLLCFVPLVTTFGCGQDEKRATAHLAGNVTVGGESLPADAEGYIQFMPDAGGQAAPTSTSIVAGKYDVEQVPLGNVTAIFNITRLTGKMVREDNAPGATPYPERENLVPPKRQAGVKIQVKGDNDAHDFDL